MRATEFIKDDTINRNPASKQWQVRADDDMALKYETPSQVLKDTTVVVQPNKKIFAYIQGTPVTSFDPTGLESFPIQFRRDADYPFYRTDTDEPITDCDYVAFHRDGSVVGYQDDELVNEIDRRGFLGAMGAGAMAAAGVPAEAKPKKPEPMAFLSAHMDKEEMLHKTARAAGMRGAELAQFLAQCYHESAGFARMHEYASGKDYEGRRDLGNVNRGDGVRYKGRGFIQITGRDNYRRAGQALGLPLEQNPELASRPDVAAKIAVWYWASRVRPNVANFNDTRAVTQRINPKLNGLADRHENFKDYKNMFVATRTGI
jgi:predicted chitinase